MSCRKAADTIDMWFRMKTHMVPWNCVLAGGQEPQGKGQFWWAPPSAMQPFVKNSLNACFFRIHYMDSPDCLLLLLSISVFTF